MSKLAVEIDKFVKAQVVNGNCNNEIEARRNIAGEISAREFLRSIEISRQQHRDGESEEITDRWIDDFVKELTEELLPHS